MSRSLNKAILIGNVGGDPEVRTTSNGGRVASFSLATSRSWNDQGGGKQEKTEWHKCIAWNNSTRGSGLADVVEKYVRKGEKVYVEGEIEYRQYQDKEGQTRYVTEIRVRELMLLGGRAGGGGDEGGEMEPRRQAAPSRPKAAPAAGGGSSFDVADFDTPDDDLPF